MGTQSTWESIKACHQYITNFNECIQNMTSNNSRPLADEIMEFDMETSSFQSSYDVDEPLLDLEAFAQSNFFNERRSIWRCIGPVIGLGFVAGIVLATVLSSGENHVVPTPTPDIIQVQRTMNVTNSNNTAPVNPMSNENTTISIDSESTLVNTTAGIPMNTTVSLSGEVKPTSKVTEAIPTETKTSVKSPQTDVNATVPANGSTTTVATDQISTEPLPRATDKIAEGGALKGNTTLQASSTTFKTTTETKPSQSEASTASNGVAEDSKSVNATV